MNSVREIIQSCYPSIDEMPFCAALRDGRFEREEILRSETVELIRATNTRGLIQEMYKQKLREAESDDVISSDDLSLMESVIDDEGETDDHIDHLDMRYKLFVGTDIGLQSKLKTNPAVDAINDEWMSICRESDLFSLMALTAAIEDWYAPLSEFFEDEYRKRGFSDEELELFIVHKGADIDHSNAQFDILERRAGKLDPDALREIVSRTFVTSKNYDAEKLKLAELNCSLRELIE
jgi:hypothetical protein